ncbi:MAG: cation:proton antiporter [Planctomycetota bacterium]
MGHSEQLLVGLASIVVLGIGAQWLAWRLKLPSILLLLTTGFVAGPVLGIVNPQALLGDTLFPLVSLSVGVILFEGGLSLKLAELREAGAPLTRLLTIGVAITWILSTLAARVLLDMSWSTALLLGAILVVTGPTVVQPLLALVRPVGKVGPVAKWEGILVDPLGAVLAVLVFEAIGSLQSAEMANATGQMLVGLGRAAVIGTTTGIGAAFAMVLLLWRHLVPDFLESLVVLMFATAAYAGANLLQPESGLLAVTVMGVFLANQKWVKMEHIIEFKENLRLLLISVLFILLAARLTIEDFRALGWQGLAFVAFLILVVRPLSVFLSTPGSGLNWREKTFLAWLAPRGIVAAAVSSVFALQLENGVLAPATILVVVVTVAVYGMSAFPLARWLKLAVPNPQGVLFAGADHFARAVAKSLQEAGVPVALVDTNLTHVRAARMQNLPCALGSVLSEHVMATFDLGGIGRFLAVTPNDEVNSLGALHFQGLFGAAEVYRLVPTGKSVPRDEKGPRVSRGRFLFHPDATHEHLTERMANGAVVKRTKLTEQFTFEDYRARIGDDALPLFLVSDSGRLTVIVADRQPNYQPGQTLIALVFDRSRKTVSDVRPDGSPDAGEATPDVERPV